MRSAAQRLVCLGVCVVGVAALAAQFHGDGGRWLGAVVQAQASCPPPAGANAIVVENCKPGTPDFVPGDTTKNLGWDVVGAGPDTIQGFATDISVDKNTSDPSVRTVHFKISVSDSAPYHLEIYRLGYYQGNGARRIARVPASGSLPGMPQTCLNDGLPGTGLVDCGNWIESASWIVPPDAVSGIYIAKAIRDTSPASGASHIYFIVRDDGSTSDLLLQTSDTTWQAYNSYGGNSLYVGGPGGKPARAYKVSYNRPFNTRASSNSRSFVFATEYPMVRWLEANGYDVTYFTGVDSDRNGALIRNHKVFLSVGHDEYWSGNQRTNVEAARAAGVHLAFFSGNEVFWKTRWENGLGANGAPYRTLVTYKESHPGLRIDPLEPNVWTGSWRDPRFSVTPTLDGLPPADGGRPENALTGTIFTVNSVPGQIAGISMIVPADDGKMRFWRKTNMATLPANDPLRVLPAGTLGYEFDEDLDNGARPAGLFRLSTTAVPDTEHIVDYGHNYASAPATHHLTLYRYVNPTNTSLVFSAGSIQFVWGLDSDHDGDLAPVPDVRMQQATVNLFADMGVQPGSLLVGLVAASASNDFTPPSSTILSVPSQLRVGTPATVTGSAQDFGVDTNSTPALLGVVAGVEVSVDNGVTWHPASGRESWTYTWTPTAQGPTVIKTRAIDDNGNLETTLTASNQAAASVGAPATPSCPCSLWPSLPTPANPAADDGGPLELGVRFRSDVTGFITSLRFYKAAGDTGTHVGHLWTSAGVLLGTATFAETASGWQGGALTSVAPPFGHVSVSANTTYVASFSTSLGKYGADNGYFAAKGQDNFPLHALRDGIDGRNGVFATGANLFPNQTSDSTNYWVDVVFDTAIAADTTSPTISGITATPAPGNTAIVHWTTNEPSASRVDYGTAADALTSNALDSTLVTTHDVTLSGLTPNTLHYFRVTSADAGGNSTTSPPLISPPASFMMPGGVLMDTTVVDFSAGTGGAGYNIEPLGDGAVTLAPGFGSDFSGTSLPAGWSACSWSDTGCNPPGNAVAAGGLLTVDGSRVGADASFLPDRSLEFVAKFSSDAFQHVGLGDTFSGPPYAMFSTNTGGGLYARTSNGSTSTDAVIAPPPGAPINWATSFHRFRIDWTAAKVVYWIDGVKVVEHLTSIAQQMRPIASDFSAGGGTVVVDWMTLDPPYSSPGTFLSRVFDSGTAVSWGTLIWSSQVPTGTSLVMSTRIGNTPTPDATWTAFTDVLRSGASIGGGSRFIQYRAQLATTDAAKTPAVNDVRIGYSAAVTPTITWNNPADIVYGTLLGPAQLNATASTPGTFAYTPASGIILGVGTGQTLSVTFTPDDPVHFTTATKSVTINVLPATPAITWNNPTDITYGTPLSATQLNASANVPGTFTYTPQSGVVLNAGSRTLHVDFTPTNLTNYTTAAKDVTIRVLQATPVISVNGGTFTYDALPHAATATANGIGGAIVPGTFSFLYDPGASSAPVNAGSYAVVANFTSADTNYTNASTGVASDGFETTSIAPFWTLRQQNGTVSLTTEQAHSGVKALKFASSSGGQREIHAAHTFAGQLNGEVSVWFYDAAAGQQTLYEQIQLYSASRPDIVAAVGTMDFDAKCYAAYLVGTPGPNAKCGDIPQATTTSVVRSPGWHRLAIRVTATGVSFSIDGTQVYQVSGTYAFDTVDLSVSGPDMRPNTTAYFDDFNVAAINTLTIGPAATVVTLAGGSFTYDGLPHPATASATGVDGKQVVGTFNITYAPGGSAAPVNVGAYTATATFTSSDANYASASGTATIAIGPRTLTVTANDATKVYGDPNPAFSASYTGFATGETPAVLAGTLAFATSATSTSGAGPYAIVPSGLTSSNYAIGFVNGTLTITKATLTVKADDKTRTYGAANPPLTGTLTGLLNNDAITAAYSTTATPASAVGTYAITATLNDPGNKLANYSVTTTNGVLTITKAPLTVKADDKSRIYGAANPLLTGTVTGVQNGDAITASYATGATLASAVGTYPITATLNDPGNTLANYSVTTTNGILTITKAPLAVKADDKSRIYGAANPLLTGTVTGVQNGDAITASYATTATAASPVASYPITATLNDPGNTLVNYSVTATNGTLTVNPAPLTVKVDDKSRTYGAANPTLTGTITGVQNSDVISASYATGATLGSPVGSYPITASLNDPGGKLTNYSVTTTNGTLTVSKAALTVTVDSKSRAYGAANPALTGTVAGVVSGDAITASYSTAATPASAVGIYPITATLNDPNNKLANYSVTTTTGTLTVNKAALTVTVDSKSRAYGAANPALTGIVAGVVSGDAITASYSTTATVISAVGTYPITATLNDPNNRLANYSVTTTNGTLTVTMAPLTVKADDKSRTYGAANPLLTGTVTGIQNGDAITASYATGATPASTVGTYPITPTLNDPNNKLSNYSVTTTNGTLTVSKAALTVSADDKSRAYGAANPTLTGTVTGVQNGDAITAGYSTTAAATSAVGSYPITATLSDPNSKLANYSLTTTDGTLTVTKAALTVKADDKSRTYGAANPTLTGTITGVLNGDAIGATYATTATATTGVGTVPITPTATGAAGTLANYTVTATNGTLTITPAVLTVTADDALRTFGASNPSFTASYSGFQNGENLTTGGITGSPSLTTTATSTSPVGSYSIVAARGTLAASNYTFSFANGTLTVAKATPAITWNNPADITIGTALSATQLNASASVPGTFVYTPPSGTVLPAGNGQTLRADFTPTDATNYNAASKSVAINVLSQVSTTTSTPTSSLNPSTFGAAVTLTSTVSSGNGTPAGTVEFFDNGVSLGTAPLVSGAASLTTKGINAGTRSVTARYLGGSGFGASTSPALTQTVNQATGTASLAVTGLTPQYSDTDTFTASFTPGVAGGPAPAKVSFTMGTQVIGEATPTLVGGVYQYAWSGQLVEPAPFGAAPTGQMKPGLRIVTATFVDPNFSVTSPSRSLTMQKEDARIAYSGPTSFSLGGTATGTVVLSVTVKDITAATGDTAWDGNPGDIRNAQVQLIDRGTNIVLGTATVSATGSTATVGTATFNWSVNLGTASSKVFSIGFLVTNYYNRNSTLDNVSITVTK